MPYYENIEIDPVKSLEGKTRIPKSLIDLPQIIAERQSRKLGSRFLQIDSEDERILEFFRDLPFGEVNRLHEQVVTIEELLSLFGQVIICLDKHKDSLPLLSFADPYMLSKVGKFHIQEKVASVYKYIVRDTKSYPVYEEGTEKKVKRIGYQPDSTIQVDSMKAPVQELDSSRVINTEEKYHNLITLPIVEMRNKQKGVHPLMEPWSGKPELATGYPVKGLIQMAYHTLRQIGKNMILVKPKIIGNFSPQDIFRFINRPCTLYIAEEESTNEAAEIADAQAKIAANLSNPITEIAKLYGVSKNPRSGQTNSGGLESESGRQGNESNLNRNESGRQGNDSGRQGNDSGSSRNTTRKH